MAARRRTIFASGGIEWDEGAIRLMLDSEGGEVGVDLTRRARAVQKRAQRKAPVGATGNLRGSIQLDPMEHGSDGPSISVSATASYAAMVEFGRREVRPVHKQWLHWQGDFTDVFTLSARAVAPVPFMRDALDAINE